MTTIALIVLGIVLIAAIEALLIAAAQEALQWWRS